MSKWRIRGYVQDSDEEEDIETWSTDSPRGADKRSVSTPSESYPHHDVERCTSQKDGSHNSTNNLWDAPIKGADVSARSGTPPVAFTSTHQRSQTESPDPLQCSPTPKISDTRKPPPSSQILGETNPFYFALLFNSSQSDDELSEPPLTDEPGTASNSPTRHVEVQDVIPQSTGFEGEHAVQRANRALRARKPIQLHPYLLEGERYRREFQSRGIKPVPTIRSPAPKPSLVDTETQEQEFDPENENPFNSPSEITLPTKTSKKSGLHGNSMHHTASSSARRKVSNTQPPKALPLPKSKRQKLDRPSTQVPTCLTEISVHDHWSTVRNIEDPWPIPHSPPYSSSPLIDGRGSVLRVATRLTVPTPLQHFPTPSNSSSIQGEFQLLVDSDSESNLGRTHQSEKQVPRSIIIPSDKSSSVSASSDSESTQSEVEVQRAGKKIKGVLPASWLRLDRQAQERKKAQAEGRDRTRSAFSPEKVEPQRGVARRINNRSRNPRPSYLASSQSKGLIDISESDESGNEHLHIHGTTKTIRESAQIASEVAAIFNDRYADDSDNMEDDRLHLFTLRGSHKERKRQLKLTESFGRLSKKQKPPNYRPKVPSSSRKTNITGTRHMSPRRETRAPPALSILDIDQSPSYDNRTLPQFIKLARRQARRGPNHGRQSPTNKHIRLHTVRHTEDASLTLQQWRDGVLKPNVSLGQSKIQQKARQPLVDRNNNNQQHIQQSIPVAKPSSATQDTFSRITSQPNRLRRRQNLPSGLSVFRNHGEVPIQRGQGLLGLSSRKNKFSKPLHRKSSLLRVAQLEGLESDFGRSHRQIAFERELRRVDRQFSIEHEQPSRNPQLVKFLAEDSSIPPPLPPTKDVGEQQISLAVQNESLPRRRLLRKSQARRIDVDAREYRQPSEPTLQDLIQDFGTEELPHQKQLTLQGLELYGARYPTTFDISPLVVGTYFHRSTFVGGGELSQAFQTGKADKRDLETFAGYYDIHHNGETVRCGPWNDETYSQIQHLLNCVWSPLYSLTPGDEVASLAIATSLCELSKILRSTINYLATCLSFLDTYDRREFTSNLKHLLETLFNKVLDFHLAENSGKFSVSQGEHQSVRVLTYMLVLSMQASQIAQNSCVESALQVDLTNLITNIAKVIVPHLVHKGLSDLGDFLEKNKRYQERENGIQDGKLLVECLVVSQQVLTSTNTTGPTFWDLVSDELSSRVENATQLKTFESVWASMFTLLPFVEFDVSGVLVVNRRASFEDGNWAFIKTLLQRLLALYPDTFKTNDYLLNEYVRTSLIRCHTLIQFWHWRRCEPMLYTVFDFFGKIGLKQLRFEETRNSPRFLECLAEQPSLHLDPSDKSFHIFLKCVALGIRGMKDVYAEKKIRSIVLRCTPNHGRDNPKDQSLDQGTLDALRNHHDLFCTLYWASPPSCRPKLDIIRSLVSHEKSHREACRLNVRAWASWMQCLAHRSEVVQTTHHRFEMS